MHRSRAHEILGIHHVHPGTGQFAWDLGFLASGIALMAIGAILGRRHVQGF